MKKKQYIAPEIDLVHLVEEEGIMLPPSIQVNDPSIPGDGGNDSGGFAAKPMPGFSYDMQDEEFDGWE